MRRSLPELMTGLQSRGGWASVADARRRTFTALTQVDQLAVLDADLVASNLVGPLPQRSPGAKVPRLPARGLNVVIHTLTRRYP